MWNMLEDMAKIRQDSTFGGRLRMARMDAGLNQEQLTEAQARQQRGNRRQRLQEIAARGPAMLTTDDTAAANVWLREYVRVFVRDNRVIEVRLG